MSKRLPRGHYVIAKKLKFPYAESKVTELLGVHKAFEEKVRLAATYPDCDLRVVHGYGHIRHGKWQ